MSRRVVIPRLSEGSVEPSGEMRKVDAPSLAAIRLVFGVGRGPGQAPDDRSFKPVYTVSIPVFSLGGLDSDGVYEFDAGALLELLQGRAKRRTWGVRLELEIVQSADTVSAADIYIDTPYAEDGPEFKILGRSQRGTTTAGGGRSFSLGSSLAGDVASARALGGTFRISVRDIDPDQEGQAAMIESEPREVKLAFEQYEFEG